MDKTIMKFGDNETKKQKLHQHKRPIFFFYINIYTLNKKIYTRQVCIHMLGYSWEQKNIHIKYKKNAT